MAEANPLAPLKVEGPIKKEGWYLVARNPKQGWMNRYGPDTRAQIEAHASTMNEMYKTVLRIDEVKIGFSYLLEGE